MASSFLSLGSPECGDDIQSCLLEAAGGPIAFPVPGTERLSSETEASLVCLSKYTILARDQTFLAEDRGHGSAAFPVPSPDSLWAQVADSLAPPSFQLSM